MVVSAQNFFLHVELIPSLPNVVKGNLKKIHERGFKLEEFFFYLSL